MATKYVDPYAPAPSAAPSAASLNNPTGMQGTGTTGGSTSGTEVTDFSRSGTSSSNTTNMDAQSLAALQGLITQLQGFSQQDRARRSGEIGNLTQQRAGYSKEAAFADAKGLMAQTMRQALEKLLPSINSGSLGAGSSQSSMRALLTQRAGENAAEAAAAQGIGAAVNYGNVSVGMSSILEKLLGQQDPSTMALINALNVAKGSVVNTNSSSSETGTSTRNTISNTAGFTTENKNIEYRGAAAPASAPSSRGMQFWGPTQTDEQIWDKIAKGNNTSMSTADLIKSLGGDSFLNNYKF